MVPGDRLFCAFVDNQLPGDTFIEWPLHITIVPWFRTNAPSDDLGRTLRQRLDGLEPFLVTVGREEKFGHKRKTVNRIVVPSPFENIEEQARQLLHERKAWMVDETTKLRRRFMPHITELKAGRAHEGDSFMVDSLYIIEQKGGAKEVAGRIDL